MIEELEKIDRMIPVALARARNWGIVCGFGYGCAFTLAGLILLLALTSHV